MAAYITQLCTCRVCGNDVRGCGNGQDSKAVCMVGNRGRRKDGGGGESSKGHEKTHEI